MRFLSKSGPPMFGDLSAVCVSYNGVRIGFGVLAGPPWIDMGRGNIIKAHEFNGLSFIPMHT
jgi:hypothetical protein